MVNGWPAMLGRVQRSPRVLGEIALGVVLVASLTFAPRDSAPNPTDQPTGPVLRYQASTVDQPSLGLTLPGLQTLAGLASLSGASVSATALIPTAPPVQLLIPILNVHRPVEAVGVSRYGFMNLPSNGWNAGWYRGGPVPGAPGDAVIEGHAGYPDQPMLFGKLGSLRRGDQIVVILADKSRRLFEVVSTTSVAVGVAPPGMGDANGSPRLTLITCTGSFDATTFSYSRRLVVEARYVGRA
ncbi:MAG: class F sortase [Candidatus Dormibacteraceae bacterium]